MSGGLYETYGKKYNEKFSLDTLLNTRHKKSDFLCPLDVEALNVEGHFESEIF